MSIGLCCQYLKIKNNKKNEYYNAAEEKTLQFGKFKEKKYSEELILSTWIQNLNNLKKILIEIIDDGFKVFRISSNLFPLYDCVPHLLLKSEILIKLKEIGLLIKQNNIRVTTHPDQYCVISSKQESIIDKSIKILEHHAWIFDQMELEQTPYYAINIHGGAKNQLTTLVNSINKLPNSIKNRLTLENDEISYSILDLYSCFQDTGIPIVFDSHHHTFNSQNLEIDKAIDLAISTWKVKPLTHLSNTEPELKNSSFQERRKHSNYVHYIFDYQKQLNNQNKIDIDFEFKMKNLAIKKACQDFDLLL